MVFYPDNPNRVQRVKDLANDIATYQDEIKSQNETQKTKDQRAYNTLASIAKSKGYDSPQEYVDAAIAALPAEQKKQLDELRQKITKTGKNADLILTISGIVATLGMVAGAALTDKGLKVLTSIGNYCTGLRTVATVVEAEIDGTVEALDALTEVAEEAFKGVDVVVEEGAAQAGTLGAEAVEGASTWLTLGRFASKALVVAAILATIGGLVYDGVEGHKQMEKCKEYTLELASKRFMVRKLKDEIEQAFGFLTDIYALLMYEDMVNEDDDIPKDKKPAKIAKKVKEVADKFAKLPAPNEDQIIGALLIKDQAAHSWTNEDPTVTQMRDYLKTKKQ